jgi:ABC-type sugar transport system permease subunit
LSAALTLGLLIAERLLFVSDPTHPVSGFIFDHIITPMQTSLGALLAIFLAVAAFRMLRRRRTAGAAWFLLSALVVLMTQVPLPFTFNADGTANGVGQVFNLMRNVVDTFTTGGMRGLLLGVALGTIATAFRVLFFIDRPQSE